jgi:NADH/F420H2 dehydrogenase subunit C
MQFKVFKDLLNIIPVVVYQRFKDENSIVVQHHNLLLALNCLKNHIGFQFKLLTCISGVDFLGKDYRFSVVYDLLSLEFNSRLRVKVFTNEVTSLSSCTDVYINANWWEREVWDLYGIYFENHPDLRRILTDYGFEGHPMRKDFPLYGYIELRYDEGKKRIVTVPVELAQDFRSFSFQTPWEEHNIFPN